LFAEARTSIGSNEGEGGVDDTSLYSKLKELYREFDEKWKSGGEAVEREGWYCPVCGKLCLFFGTAPAGPAPIGLFACENPEHMGTYHATRSGYYSRKATEEERKLREKKMASVIPKRLQQLDRQRKRP